MKKVLRSMLIVVLIAAIFVMPVEAKSERAGLLRVTIEAQKWESEYPAYATRSEGDEHVTEVFLEEDEFPVVAMIKDNDGYLELLKIEAYGTRYLSAGSFNGDDCFATLKLSRPEKPDDEETAETMTENCGQKRKYEAQRAVKMVKTSSLNRLATCLQEASEVKKEPLEVENETEKEGLIDPADTLIELVDFPFPMNDYNRSKLNIDAFYAGNWSGEAPHKTCKDIYPFIYLEGVSYREYSFLANNLLNGETYELKQNVDYSGSWEWEGGKNFTLAYSREEHKVEMWQEFERLDSWELPETETIDSVLPLNTASDMYGSVMMYDVDDQKHVYCLCPNGVIK